ncbi:hypothetical protein [Branchiibius sp. NY16-3462-2]|uniref:hypothetical protein n=1 Tax=Branchiibius sp. NY16-3462-2 TaxID=1807500 RepID=UPI0025C2184E|nr:hypothetical protein [Branchiibius sp. NY16-3462-2]
MTNQVRTPAGPADPRNVHQVDPGQGVVDDDGLQVVDEHVLTPGGWKHRSLVHEVPPGMRVEHHRGRLRLVDEDGQHEIDCGAEPVHPPGRPLQPRASSESLRTRAELLSRRSAASKKAVPALGEGWITYASWTNDTGTPVSRFSTTWTVPPAPRTDHGQTIFLFNGIQNSTMIYQPVLQWGPSAAGGGSKWSVASWYADGQTGQSFHSTLVDVNVGDVLTGVMVRGRKRANGYSYGCSFTGIANTNLPVFNIQELTWCIETLEVYGAQSESDYPDVAMTGMRNIELRCGSAAPDFLWTVNNAVTDIGQHCVVVNEKVTGAGEVDLWYRPSSWWLSGFGAIASGASQDWWFTFGGTGDAGPQLIQAEPVEPSGQLTTISSAESLDSNGYLTYHATVRNDGPDAVHFQWRGGGR